MNNELKSNDNTFKLIDKVKDYDLYLRKYVLINIPKVHNDIRIHILDELYYLIKNIRLCTFNKGNILNKYLIESLVNISVLDYLFDNLIELNIGDKKKIITSLSKLANIKNIIYSWYNKINEK